MDSLLDFRIEILDAKGGAVEARFPQGGDVIADNAAGIDFHSGFDVLRRR